MAHAGLLIAALAAAQTAHALPRVSYVVEEVPGSWQPLEPADLASTIEHAALEVLTKPGLMQLVRASKKSLEKEKGDYVLLIQGRTLDEAETHTVYLTFEAGGRADVPSLRTSDTVVLGKQARAAMIARVEASARKAASDLLGLLAKELEAARGRGAKSPEPPAWEDRLLPWRWPEVDVPKPSASRAASGIYSKKREERMASLRELTSLALVDASPRNALERCALDHDDKDMRLGCLVALRPLSRRIEPTQRVVIEAFRKDAESNVRGEASEQMTYFTGLARTEAIAAWLESAAACREVGPLDRLGELPNLDMALARCLVACGKKPKYQRSKRSCIELLDPLPLERRRRILWTHLEEMDPESPYYLEGAGEREGSTGTDWQWAAEKLLENATEWDPKLEELLWKRYQRTLSSSSLDMLADHAEPTPKLLERMFEVLQTAGKMDALRAIARIAKAKPELRPNIREKIAELIHTRAYPKSISEHQLQELEKQLAKEPKP